MNKNGRLHESSSFSIDTMAERVFCVLRRVLSDRVYGITGVDLYVFFKDTDDVPFVSCSDAGDLFEVERDICATLLGRLYQKYIDGFPTKASENAFLRRVRFIVEDPFTSKLMTEARILPTGYTFHPEEHPEFESVFTNEIVEQVAKELEK